MNRFFLLSLIAIAFLMTNCAHKIDMRGFDAGSGSFPLLQGKKVAIVVAPGKIRDDYSTNTDVYTYQFSGVSQGVTDALKSRIGLNAKKVDVFNDGQTIAPEGYDVVIYPEVNARSVHDFWTMGCLVKFRIDLRKNGETVASESGEGKRNFFSADQADEKCKIAMAEVFGARRRQGFRDRQASLRKRRQRTLERAKPLNGKSRMAYVIPD